MSAFALFARGHPTGGSFGTSYPCYAFKTIGLPNDELWLTARIAFPSSTSAYRIDVHPPGTNGSVGYAQAFYNTGTYFSEALNTLEGIEPTTDLNRWEEIAQGFSLHTAANDPPIQYAKWYTLESHYEASGSRGSIIHCAGSWSHSSPATGISRIAVGCFFARTGFFLQGLYDTFEMVCDHVKVGTTRKGNDVFEDDFASGDLSAWSGREFGGWTGTEGDPSVGFGVTVIARPSYPNFNELCPIEARREGVYLPPITEPYGADYVQP